MQTGMMEWGSDGELVRAVVVVPVRMPTWNRLLSMHHFERKKCRDLLHRLTCTSLTTAIPSQTPKGLALNTAWMRSCVQAYLPMIAPVQSAKSETGKRKSAKKKRRRRNLSSAAAILARLKTGSKSPKINSLQPKKPTRNQ